MRQSSLILMGLVISILIIMTAQGWTGDFVNLFAVFPSGKVRATFSGFIQALVGAGRMEVIHVILRISLMVLTIVALVVTFRSDASKWSRAWVIIGFLGVLSAVYGGLSFVLSGFQNDGNSAQMGGSFIGSYASYFLLMYFNKR
jgi:hypothetical protein